MRDLLQQTKSAIDALESVRESIIGISATDANRAVLDAAYLAVVEAIEQLTKLSKLAVKS